MKTEITVKVMACDEGYFVAEAVDYPGVVTFGKSIPEIESGIWDAFFAVKEFNEMKQIGKSSRPMPNVQSDLCLKYA